MNTHPVAFTFDWDANEVATKARLAREGREESSEIVMTIVSRNCLVAKLAAASVDPTAPKALIRELYIEIAELDAVLEPLFN